MECSGVSSIMLHTIDCLLLPQFVTTIAFNPLGNAGSTNVIIVGTACGHIYEAQIDAGELDRYFNPVYKFDPIAAISGSYFEIIASPGHATVLFVLLTTTHIPNRIYYFHGGPTCDAV